MSHTRHHRHDDHDRAPRGYFDRGRVEPEPEISVNRAAALSGVAPRTVMSISGPSWTLPQLITLPDGGWGWRGQRNVDAVLEWCNSIRHPKRIPPAASDKTTITNCQ